MCDASNYSHHVFPFPFFFFFLLYLILVILMVESGMRDLSLEIWMSGFETQLNYKIFEFNLSSQFLKKW